MLEWFGLMRSAHIRRHRTEYRGNLRFGPLFYKGVRFALVELGDILFPVFKIKSILIIPGFGIINTILSANLIYLLFLDKFLILVFL